MATSTTATLAGIMERIQADALAGFKTVSTLFNSVNSVECTGGTSVQFATYDQPAAIAAQAVEGNSIASTTLNLTAVPAVLDTYPILATVTNKALFGGVNSNVVAGIGASISGKLAATVDTQIATLMAGFATTEGDALTDITLTSVVKALGKLHSNKFFGTPVIVLHPISFAKIAGSIMGLNAISKAEELGSNGFLGSFLGAELYISPYVTNGGGAYKNGIFFKETAIGLAYRNPLINITSAPNLAYAGVDFLGEAYLKVVEITDLAGVTLNDKV